MSKGTKLYTLTLTESEARDIVNAWSFLGAFVNRKEMGTDNALDFAANALEHLQKSESFDSANGSTTQKLNEMLDLMIQAGLDRLEGLVEGLA